jgi:hypothetical protein
MRLNAHAFSVQVVAPIHVIRHLMRYARNFGKYQPASDGWLYEYSQTIGDAGRKIILQRRVVSAI